MSQEKEASSVWAVWQFGAGDVHLTEVPPSKNPGHMSDPDDWIKALITIEYGDKLPPHRLAIMVEESLEIHDPHYVGYTIFWIMSGKDVQTIL